MSSEISSYTRLMNGFVSNSDYFKSDVELGTIRTSTGTRICVLSDDFMNGFRTAVNYECGKASDRIYRKCGYQWGTAFVTRYDRELSEHYGVSCREVSTGIMEKAIDEAFRFYGWGTFEIDYSDYELGYLHVTVCHSFLSGCVEDHIRTTDWIMVGFLAALFSYYSESEMDCVQTQFSSQQASVATFIVSRTEKLKPINAMVQDKLTHSIIKSKLKLISQ